MRTPITIFIALLVMSPVFARSKDNLSAIPVAMPGGQEGIGFDDLGFSADLKKVIVPGGHTGKLFLIDPNTKEMITIEGLKAESGYKGGHGEGTTSADEGDGFIFAVDRSAMLVDVIDPIKKRIISSAALANGPDYVRYVRETNQVWVTQPESERIEIFTFSATLSILPRII